MILTTNTSTSTTPAPVNPVLKAYPAVLTGPDRSDNSQELVYRLTAYTYKSGGTTVGSPTADQQMLFDDDKDNLTWVMWVSGGLMETATDYVVISNRTLREEIPTDFNDKSDKKEFIKSVEDHGYVEANIETVVEGGIKYNQLRIKLSKWLDDKEVHFEIYRNGPDHNVAKDYVKTTQVFGFPELLDIYWVDEQSKIITATGYETQSTIVVDSIGLKDSTIELTLFDKDDGLIFNDDDKLLWNDGNEQNTVQITGRKTYISYNVEAEDSAAYENGHGDEFDSDLEVFIKISNVTNPTLKLNLDLGKKYAHIIFTPNQVVNPYFATRKTINQNGNDVFQYNPIDELYPGVKVYLVAEFTNVAQGTEVTFSASEETPLLVGDGENVSLIEGTTEETSFTARVLNGYAVIEVTLQTLDSARYTEWLNIIMPSTGDDKKAPLKLSVSVESTTYDSTLAFNVVAPKVYQRIYYDGFISRENYVQNIIKKVKLIYHTRANVEHDFGTFDIIWAQKWVSASSSNQGAGWKKVTKDNKTRYYQYDGIPNANKTPLVKIFNSKVSDGYPNISTGNPRNMFEYRVNESIFVRLSEDTNREYFNPERISSLLGAIIDSGYDDVVTNGSVDSDGTGAPSVTHVNGNNIDFKYLRTDNNRPRIDISGGAIFTNSSLLDKTRQNAFLDSAFKFGFSTRNKSVSWYFDDENKTDSNLLKHCKTTENKSHHDHLHLQGFQAKYKS